MNVDMIVDVLGDFPQDRKFVTGALLAHLRAVAAQSGVRIDAELRDDQQDLWQVTAICDARAEEKNDKIRRLQEDERVPSLRYGGGG